MNLAEDVQQDAVDFIIQHDEDFKAALVNDDDFDRNSIDCLDSSFHEDIVDRSYTLEDAAHVVSNCENEETDTGLWDGQQPEDALRAKAAYCYGNDVWHRMDALFADLKEAYEEFQGQLTDRADELRAQDTLTEQEQKELERLENELDEEAAALAFAKFERDNAPPPIIVEQGSPEEGDLLARWLDLNARAGLLWSGYPMGDSYIDARCGVGYGMPEIKDYVDFDHVAAKRMPHWRGKRRDEIQTYASSLQAR